MRPTRPPGLSSAQRCAVAGCSCTTVSSAVEALPCTRDCCHHTLLGHADGCRCLVPIQKWFAVGIRTGIRFRWLRCPILVLVPLPGGSYYRCPPPKSAGGIIARGEPAFACVRACVRACVCMCVACVDAVSLLLFPIAAVFDGLY